MSDSDPADGERPFTALPKPEPDEKPMPAGERPSRRGWLEMPEGAIGFFILLLLAAAGGALIVLYWPWMTGTPADNTAVSDRLGALETRVGQIAAGHAPKAAAAAFDEERRNLAALRDRIDADEARLTALEKSAGSGGDTGLAEIGQRLDKLEAAGGGPQAPQLAGKLADTEKALDALRKDADARAKANGEALDKLGGRIAELEKSAPPADLAERLDSFALKSGVAALETRLARLEDQDTAGLMRRAASMLALADLVRASEREQPFATELDALRALVPVTPDLADLSRYAQRGVPTTATLTARFSHGIDAILAAERAARAANWAERAWFDLVNLVSVRRVGDVPGNGTEARLARAEFALKTGDLAAAVAEVEQLDKPARAAASAWLKDARARLAVNRDARALTSRIVSDLAAASARAKASSAAAAGAQP